MKFIDPSFTELYNTLKNNKRLEKFFINQYILNSIDDYYENYGYNNQKYKAEKIVNDANKIVYEQLTDLLLSYKEHIKESSIKDLVARRYLATEIKEALNFTNDIEIADDILWEIFYCLKYCYTSSFFQNNWEYFVPDVDYTEMEKNPSIMGFMDAIMKEFDKLDSIMDDVKKYKSYQDIPYDYIVYLTQLMGIEPKHLMIMQDQKKLYRTIAENIMDVYSVRGVADTFTLLFNFLGYDINIEEYFFDRRRYFAISEANEELTTSDINSYKFYLTTKDPRDNILDELSTNEIVTPEKMTEILDAARFDDLVKESSLMCVLGYDDEYLVENKVDGIVKSVDVVKYTGPVYKYFKTNYIRIKPSPKYSTGNFSLNQLYQISALLSFLTPEFLKRETYLKIDTGSTEESMILNWTKDFDHDSFYMLDSEDWRQNFADKFIIDYYGENGYNNNSYSIKPYVLDDLGNKKLYVNSLGKNLHYANERYNNVFFNPISEKIKIINSTKYWGDKVKINNSSEKLYPVYRINEKYTINGQNYYNPAFKVNSTQVNTLYLPKNIENLPSWEQKQWENMEVVDLNGFGTTSLKNKIREMTYKSNSYFDYAEHTDKKSKSEGIIKIDYVINNSIKDFLDENKTTNDSDDDKKKIFFEKGWKETDNFTWKAIFEISAGKFDFIDGFAAKHKNIINYDYINKKLFCFNEFYNLSFKTNGDYEIVGDKREQYNEDTLELINRLVKPGNYFIVLNETRKKYIVYQYKMIKSFKNLSFNKRYPLPTSQNFANTILSFSTYRELIGYIDNDNILNYNNKSYDLSTENDIIFYISTENMYYKPLTAPTSIKRIIHKNDLNSFITTIRNFSEDFNEEKIAESKIGSTYFVKLTPDELDDNRYAILKDKRKNKYIQYKYVNIKEGILIYSKKDEKLYRVINSGVYIINKPIKVAGNVSPSSNIYYDNCKLQDGGIFGIEEINFYGRFVLDGDTAKIYEYDDSYYGFSEQDDDDNFIFNNYDRVYEWEKMRIYSKDDTGKRDKVKTEMYKKMLYTEISNDRPIKVNIDNIFELRDENNVISSDILEEICESYGSSYIGKDNVTSIG